VSEAVCCGAPTAELSSWCPWHERIVYTPRLTERERRQAMLDAIRVIDVHVDRIEGQSKLNQHKSDADHVAVANALARAPGAPARELSLKMRALRPHLDYDVPEAPP